MISSKHPFGPYLRWLAVPALALLLVLGGCKKNEEQKAVVAAPLHAPAKLTDDAGWQAYYGDVVDRNSKNIEGTASPFYLPAPGGPDYDDQYGRQLQGVSDALERGVLPGNMLAFMSPDSTKMADLVVAAFGKASPGSLKKVTVLFIGKPVDNDRVKAVVEPTGASYKFVPFD